MTDRDFGALEARHEALSSSHKELKDIVKGLIEAVSGLTNELRENTLATKDVQKNTADLVKVMNAGRSAITFAGWVGKAGAKLSWLALPITVAWASMKAGAADVIAHIINRGGQ